MSAPVPASHPSSGSESPGVNRDALARALAAHPAAPGDPERRRLAIALARDSLDALDWMSLAFEELSGYRFEQGHAALGRAIALAPDFLPARWLRMNHPLHPAPVSMEEAASFRTAWDDGLALFEQIDFRLAQWQSQVWGCIGSCTSFYRHYLDEDCVTGQRRYGALLHRMMAAIDPGDPPRPLATGRRRVLFCSPYFYQHTVARLFLPLIEALDARRFDIHLLHFGHEDDDWTARASRCGTFHRGPLDPQAWRQRIADLAPDVIVHLDLGMHPLPQALAALRLAPVQAVMWGHPVTTGLPTVDYVLSPDAMEPRNADHHYSERLVRLPGLGHGLDPLQPIEPAPHTDDAPLDLLCAQSIYKLMPAQDALFARIVAALPGARLHLIPHQTAEVRDWLRERMRPAFAAHRLDVEHCVVLHGHRSLDGFLQLAASCAINLDSIGWSGGMSSLDVLRLGIPTVTRPGRFMRSRQTAAVLQALDVPELVVDSDDAYVELAIALGRDPARRATLAARLRAGLPRLHERDRVARALGDFLATCKVRRR
jgi:protein O-GlcNAc transferase